ncbi:sensor histidine kinase [Clostridium lundense]|uniref:sensor histidine kinase n=1 Tax=Clostridium lundense TaxID=319475 RepID=UPI0004895F17|nr:HAMP domain-containing sensor histidine kinase [Clostridium lundense]
MKANRPSVKNLCLGIVAGMLITMILLIVILYLITGKLVVIIAGLFFMVCTLLWLILFMWLFEKQLTIFTGDLCNILDDMINGSEELEQPSDEETLFARINHRLSRLYGIMQENRRKVDEEREKLQVLVSDISHQVKTPISNLKMITDTLLTKPVSHIERIEFLHSIQGQLDKLDFLMQAIVKTSRLEIGVIQLEKKRALLYETLALALSGIVYPAEKKSIDVTVSCSEDLQFPHDSKWTAEALFNILDNAVKYTSIGGMISVVVEELEIYVKVNVNDTGKGISESNQASIFQRFYREEEVHDEPGIGIGLYLAREIITQQGGYIKVNSEVGKGSNFSIFLPNR